GVVRSGFPADAHPWALAPPASFSLGPGHTIRIDADGTTVTFDGVEHHTAPYRAGADLVWLPIQYTPLDVSKPVAGRRHFIQSFVWHHNSPDDTSVWSLGWFLEEVVAGDVHSVAMDGRLITIAASQPPPPLDP